MLTSEGGWCCPSAIAAETAFPERPPDKFAVRPHPHHALFIQVVRLEPAENLGALISVASDEASYTFAMLSDSEIDQKKQALGHIPAFINTAGFEATGRRARQGIRPKHSSYNNDSQQLVLPHAWTSSTGTDGRTKAKVQLERSLTRSEDAVCCIRIHLRSPR